LQPTLQSDAFTLVVRCQECVCAVCRAMPSAYPQPQRAVIVHCVPQMQHADYSHHLSSKPAAYLCLPVFCCLCCPCSVAQCAVVHVHAACCCHLLLWGSNAKLFKQIIVGRNLQQQQVQQRPQARNKLQQQRELQRCATNSTAVSACIIVLCITVLNIMLCHFTTVTHCM
jgi:hypothetical protein